MSSCDINPESVLQHTVPARTDTDTCITDADADINGKNINRAPEKSLEFEILYDKLERPAFKALYAYIKSDPRLRTLRSDFYAQRSDLLDPGFDSDHTISLCDHPYRRVQGLLVNICLAARDETLRPMLEHAIDFEAARDSKRLKQDLFSGKQHHIPVLLTGAGAHAAIFNSAYTSAFPNSPSVTIERTSKLGGQFRKYGAPVIRMNTESAPIRQDKVGSIDRDDFNSLGADAILQLNQLTGDLFPTNMDVGLAIALNQYLRSYTVLSVETIESEPDPDASFSTITLEDVETGDRAVHTTGVDILVPGLGEDRRGYRNADDKSAEAIEKNYELELKERYYFTYGEFLTLCGSLSGTISRTFFSNKTIIVEGGGHSALTAIERITGIFNDVDDYSVSSISGPRQIHLVGSKYATAHQLQSEEMGRYGQVSRLFPQFDGDLNSLVNPICGNYAYQLRKSDTDVTLLHGSKMLSQKDNYSVEELTELQGDIVVSTTGFDPVAEKILAGEQARNYGKRARLLLTSEENSSTGQDGTILCDSEEMELQAEAALQISECTFKCVDGEAYTFKKEGDVWLVCDCDNDGIPDMETAVNMNDEQLQSYIHLKRPPIEILYPAWDGSAKTLPPIICNETKDIIGRYGFRNDTLIAGPASAPVVGEYHAKREKLYGSPMNKVSISASRRATWLLGKMVANRGRADQATFPIIDRTSRYNPENLSMPIRDSQALEPQLKYSLLRAAYEYQPESTTMDDVRVTLVGNGDTFTVRTNRVLKPNEYDYLYALLSDPSVSQIGEQIVSRGNPFGYTEMSFPVTIKELTSANRKLMI